MSSIPISPNIDHMGDFDRGMRLIRPSSTARGANIAALDLLRRIGKALSRPTTRRVLDGLVARGGEDGGSVRMIETDRYEIFLDRRTQGNNGTARKKKRKRQSETGSPSSTEAWDEIVRRAGCVESADEAREEVVRYATQQAQKDSRLERSDASREGSGRGGKRRRTYKFGNFSIIASYSKVGAQAPHIDLLPPNFQFGLTMTAGCTGTLLFDVAGEYHISTVDDLRATWEGVTEEEGVDVQGGTMPENVLAAMHQNSDITRLLKDFGDVLLPEKLVESKYKQRFSDLPLGSLLSLPGGVVHAGPESDGFRAILFFSAWPTDSSLIPEYDPDIQFNGVFLAGHFVGLLWKADGIGYEERVYLLKKLASYVLGSTTKRCLAGHFVQGGLAYFVESVEALDVDTYSKETLNDLIRKGAKDESLCDFKISEV